MNTQRMIRFVEVVGDWYDQYSPGSPIADGFRRVAQKISSGTLKDQKRDLKYAISDLGEFFSEAGDKLSEYDQFFTNRGAMSVSEVVMIHKGKMAKIIKGERIKNENEAIFVSGLLSQMDTDLLEEERHVLTRLLKDYENRITA